MKKKHAVVVVLFAVLVGIVMPDVAVGANPKKGAERYVQHEFDEAVIACEGGKDFHSRLILGLAYTEKYNIYKRKLDKEQAKMYLDIVETDAKMEDTEIIATLLAVKGNPNGNKAAMGVLAECFKNAKSTPEDILTLALFLDPMKGTDVNKLAAAAIYKRLKPVRDYVAKGGEMPSKMKGKVFANPALIKPLVGALADKKAASYAKKCLILIQDPAIKYLDEAEMTKSIAAALVSVKKAIISRQKKHADSTWYSAAGE
jgi:hypothetical protein